MNEVLEASRVLLSLFFLVLSSWQDMKKREVSNKMWAVYGPAGLVLLIMQLFFDSDSVREGDVVLWLASIGLTAAVALVLFYTGFFGGADSKAFICLAITLPVYPSFALRHVTMYVFFFPLAVLVNSVLGASLLTIVIVCYNLSQVLRNEKLFEGLENEPFWSKAIVFATGFKVRAEKMKGSSFYFMLEQLSREENKGVVRRLKVTPRLDDDPQKEAQQKELLNGLHGKIWVTPGLPFLVFVTAGFIVALVAGDFTSWLIQRIVAP
ncbi:prepilin peptidase [Candidatus Bathyarchaeota archaeon]|nr:prepilin peptidase [Candidatus Bathyarchaeota archaeon]